MTIDAALTFGSSVNSIAQRFVTVNGKDYAVKRTIYKNPLILSNSPIYKDAVVVDGKKHYVMKTPTVLSKDGTKDIVVINGKSYDVHQKNDIMSVVHSAVTKILNKN